MARGKSVIEVLIVGDARKLIGAVDDANTKTGGLVKSAVKIGVATVGVRKGFDAIGDALSEADRRGDALSRLDAKLGDLDDTLIATSDSFSKIGASSQDVLELEAIYADLATSAGLAAPEIAGTAESLSIAALAAAQVHDEDPTAIMEAIGKAAGGQTRGIKDYGVNLSEAAVQQEALRMTGKDNPKQLTDTELAMARVNLILEAFNPLVKEATEGTGDLALKQDEFGAKLETVSGKIGQHVEGPATDLLDWINDMVDAIPSALDGWGMLGDQIFGTLRSIKHPLQVATEALGNFITVLGQANRAEFDNDDLPSRSDRGTSQSVDRWYERNGLGR